MQRIALALAVLYLAVNEAPAQKGRSVSAATKPSRHLDQQEVKALLEELRLGILTEMMPERIAKRRKNQRNVWLKKFQAIQSDHYMVFTNGPRNTVKKFAQSLEEIYEFTRVQFPFEDIDSLLTAYIFQTRDDYVDFSVKITGFSREAAKNTGGHSTGRYYATYYQSPGSDTVVHEATHQIVSRCLKAGLVGSWFQEGMAVYIEKLKNRASKPSAGMKAALRQGKYYPLEEFFALRSLLSDSDGHGRRSYDHAGALIDFMVNAKRQPVAGKFSEFLTMASKVRTIGKDISIKLIYDVYGLTIADFEAAWKRHYGLRK